MSHPYSVRKSLSFSRIIAFVCLLKSSHENSAACFWRSTLFPSTPLFPPRSWLPALAQLVGGQWRGQSSACWNGTWERGERQSPGDGQAGRKAGLKYGACASSSSLFGVLTALLEGAVLLWQRSYGSFPSLTSEVLKLTAFYCFFSSSPLITWPPYVAAADKIYTWRKIPLNILFFTFSLFPNTTRKACNAKLHIIY